MRAFLSHRPYDGDLDRLGDLLTTKLAVAAGAWPAVRLEAEEFVAALAERIEQGADLLEGLAQLREADLYLAVAAATNSPGGVAAFESAILARVPSYLVRFGVAPTFVEEVQQALRVKLFVAEDPRDARIRRYSGRGALESWVCAVAIRIAHDLIRSRARHEARGEEELEVLGASDDPELELMRRRYQAEFRAALGDTIAALAPRQRTLLRMHFFERLTTIDLGRLYGVNQSTASRWLAEARQTVLVQVRERLIQRLGVSETEMDSLLGLLQSRLDVSFHRLLQTDAT